MTSIALIQRPWLPALLLGGLSLLYYASYFTAGFNYADEGNYVQFVRELSRGTSLRDLPVSYGLLWFKIGEAAFRLFGPNLLVARCLFFTCILATSLLTFVALHMLTGRPWLAAAFAAVPALAPAFPPTAFYGLCILINTVPQLRLVERFGALRARDIALAGAALSISFQIRPDFGYIFALPLAAIICAAAWSSPQGTRMRTAARLLLPAGAAFLGAQMPGLILAINDNYLATLFGQYLSYPVMLADYGVRGLSTLFGGDVGTGAHGSGALLQRPRLVGAQDLAEFRLALLVYLPVLITAAFLTWCLNSARRAQNRAAYLLRALVVVTAGAAALPHYFFYRPDISHIANFIPGFTVLAGLFVFEVVARAPRSAWMAIPAVIAGILGIYLFTALVGEGTGSIAGTFGRTERFHAANGVDVRLHPGEKAMLNDLKTLIEANSAPGDAIVCVPYCPGIAFMTDRRLLFREQYVDDSLPSRDPGWLDRAGALTRAQRPPVVIVMDWAINGTDISRFSRWASPYMETVESLAREKTVRPGLTVYLLRSGASDAISR